MKHSFDYKNFPLIKTKVFDLPFKGAFFFFTFSLHGLCDLFNLFDDYDRPILTISLKISKPLTLKTLLAIKLLQWLLKNLFSFPFLLGLTLIPMNEPFGLLYRAKFRERFEKKCGLTLRLQVRPFTLLLPFNLNRYHAYVLKGAKTL